MARALAQPTRFYATMTDVQRAELARSIAEAERGEVVDKDWEAFESWVARPAEAIPALKALARNTPTWRR